MLLMTFFGRSQPPEDPSPPLPDGFAIERWSPNVAAWRAVLARIGSKWHWDLFRDRKDALIEARLAEPERHIYRLLDRRHGADPSLAGFAELVASGTRLELVHFALVDEVQGLGLGLPFLCGVLEAAEATMQPKPELVWLHTDTNDHPAAARMYHRAGLRPWRQLVTPAPQSKRGRARVVAFGLDPAFHEVIAAVGKDLFHFERVPLGSWPGPADAAILDTTALEEADVAAAMALATRAAPANQPVVLVPVGKKLLPGTRSLMLPARVGAVVDALHAAASEPVIPVRAGGWRLALEARLLIDDVLGRPAEPLTEAETRLLGRLTQANGQFVARDELIQLLGHAQSAETHAVETLLSRLRRKLVPEPGLPDPIPAGEGGWRLRPWTLADDREASAVALV